jgi:uncharacterized protein YraI
MPGRTARALAMVAVSAVGFLLPASAVADPATTVAYPAGAAATRYAGLAFDTCTAPPLAAVKAWGASPYRAVGVYIGGVNRTCSQPQLTAGWVSEVSKLGWRLLPIYKGRQPSCGGRPTDQKITAAGATAEGTAAGTDAVARAKALGMLAGSGLYLDIEHYSTTDAACRTAVLRFTSAYTRQLHRQGYLSGVYANLSSGAIHLSQAYTSTSYARPDALWIARWDGDSSLTGWAGVPDSRWAVHQRAKQYRGDHTERHGGVTINIDSDRLDAPVATVAHAYKVTGGTSLNARSGPSTSYPIVKTYASGSTLRVACQTPGSKVGTTSVWDKLPDGTYVTDYHVGTPSNTTYSSPLPRCHYPYQVAAPDGVNRRTGPGTSYPTVGRLPTGGLAWIACQKKAGSGVGTTTVWDKLNDGRWVTDYAVATPSKITYSRSIPQC